MQNIARLIGIVSLLVALPLLWMAWVLAANLAGLLMLNERRTFGLMRLRGISGQLMGRALLISVDAGGLARRPARADRRIGRAAADLRTRAIAARRAARRTAARDLRRVSAGLGRARAGREPPAGQVRDDDLAARGVGPRVGVRSDERVDPRSASVQAIVDDRRQLRAARMDLRLRDLGSAADATGSDSATACWISSGCRCSSTASRRCWRRSASASSTSWRQCCGRSAACSGDSRCGTCRRSRIAPWRSC